VLFFFYNFIVPTRLITAKICVCRPADKIQQTAFPLQPEPDAYGPREGRVAERRDGGRREMAHGQGVQIRFGGHPGAGRRRGQALQRDVPLRGTPVADGGQTGGRLRRRQGRVHRRPDVRGVRRLPKR